MRKLGLLLLLVALMFAYSNEAAAAGIQKGASEFTVNGSLSQLTSKMDDSDSKTTSYTNTGTLGYSYFLTDQVSVGANLLYSGSETEDDAGTSTSNDVTTGIDLNAKYHFIFSKGQTVVPYLGLQGGWINMYSESTYTYTFGTTTYTGTSDSSGSAGSYGGMAGVKFFITENVSINTELNYRAYNITMNDGYSESKMKMNNLALLFGLSVYFGK